MAWDGTLLIVIVAGNATFYTCTCSIHDDVVYQHTFVTGCH